MARLWGSHVLQLWAPGPGKGAKVPCSLLELMTPTHRCRGAEEATNIAGDLTGAQEVLRRQGLRSTQQILSNRCAVRGVHSQVLPLTTYGLHQSLDLFSVRLHICKLAGGEINAVKPDAVRCPTLPFFVSSCDVGVVRDIKSVWKILTLKALTVPMGRYRPNSRKNFAHVPGDDRRASAPNCGSRSLGFTGNLHSTHFPR